MVWKPNTQVLYPNLLNLGFNYFGIVVAPVSERIILPSFIIYTAKTACLEPSLKEINSLELHKLNVETTLDYQKQKNSKVTIF